MYVHLALAGRADNAAMLAGRRLGAEGIAWQLRWRLFQSSLQCGGLRSDRRRKLLHHFPLAAASRLGSE
jgi:hypothetical protein